MKTLSRKSLFGAFALVASLSAPMAFAQSAEASTQATAPAETAAPSETSAQGATAATPATPATPATAATKATISTHATPATPAMPATPAVSAAVTAQAGVGTAKKSWSDVDADKDGKLTQAEASSVPALSKVFVQADVNADGALTTDEYKAYVAMVQGGSKSNDGGK